MAFRRRSRCAFWLGAAKDLHFDPRTTSRPSTISADFPNLLRELRDAPVEDPIPRGYGDPAPIPLIFESGGTTGAPKRTAQLPDWVEQVTRWQVENFAAGGFIRGSGLVCLMPSGPHGVGYFSREVSRRLGSAGCAEALEG